MARRDRLHRSHFWDEPVAAPAQPCDIAWGARIVPEGIAQQLHASIDSLGADDESGPDLGHQFIVRKYRRRCTEQHEQQIEGELWQSNLGSRARDALAREIDQEVGDLIRLQRSRRTVSDARSHDAGKHT